MHVKNISSIFQLNVDNVTTLENGFAEVPAWATQGIKKIVRFGIIDLLTPLILYSYPYDE